MKLLIYLFIAGLCISLVFAATERSTLKPGDSFLFDGKNIMLFDTSDDSVIICINNDKTIVSDEKTVNDVSVKLVDSNERDAELKFTFDCDDIDDCECDGDECNNSLCTLTPTTLIDTTIQDDTTTPENPTTTLIDLNIPVSSTTTLLEESSFNAFQISTALFAIVALVLFIVLIIKKSIEP